LVPRLGYHHLTLLCRYHHHNFLGKGWECRINSDGLPQWRPPWWVDRERRPMINNRIAATSPRKPTDASSSSADDVRVRRSAGSQG
jgi:hypothetical protein